MFGGVCTGCSWLKIVPQCCRYRTRAFSHGSSYPMSTQKWLLPGLSALNLKAAYPLEGTVMVSLRAGSDDLLKFVSRSFLLMLSKVSPFLNWSMAMTKKSYPWRWKGWWRSDTGAVIINTVITCLHKNSNVQSTIIPKSYTFWWLKIKPEGAHRCRSGPK